MKYIYTSFTYSLISILFLLGCNSYPKVKIADRSNIGVISGIVELGSSCGIKNSQTNNQCQTKPLSVSMTLTPLSGGAPVKKIKSDSKGLFQVSVISGRYRLKVAESFFPPASTIVNVITGKESKVRLMVSTGVR